MQSDLLQVAEEVLEKGFCSISAPLEQPELVLETWQAYVFCETLFTLVQQNGKSKTANFGVPVCGHPHKRGGPSFCLRFAGFVRGCSRHGP